MNSQQRFRVAVIAACLIHAVLLLLQPAPRHVVEVPLGQLKTAPIVAVELTFQAPHELNQGDDQLEQKPAADSVSPIAAGSPGRPPGAHPHDSAAADSNEVQALLGPTEGTPESVAAPSGSASGPPAPQAGGAKRLPPRKQGIGDDFGLAYAMSKSERAPQPGAESVDRLRRSMQQALANNDREVGIHVPAQLMLALESAARDVAIPTNSVATFVANFDGSGSLLSLEFAGSNHASPQWTNLSRRVEQALRGRKLEIAKNTKGVDIKLRLESRAQLPSGHDPGLGVDVLGIPVKKGQSKRSTKITLLDPLQLTLLGINGDPADIGAPTRQIIRVQVLAEKIY